MAETVMRSKKLYQIPLHAVYGAIKRSGEKCSFKPGSCKDKSRKEHYVEESN